MNYTDDLCKYHYQAYAAYCWETAPEDHMGVRLWRDSIGEAVRDFSKGEPTLKLKIMKLKPTAIIPTYAHGPNEDAGMDLYAAEPAMLHPFLPTLVRTGLAIELPPGVEAQIRPRSGLALKHGVTIPNSPGTIDPSYRGEVGVILLWTGAPHGSSARFVVEAGDRIAQMVVRRYEGVEWVESEYLTGTVRGSGGFGSTGVSSNT